jgi:septal ring factor EnvC (AmiA/AmiB activator)
LAEGGGIIKKVAEAIFKLLGKDAARAGEKKAAQEAEEAALKKAERSTSGRPRSASPPGNTSWASSTSTVSE